MRRVSLRSVRVVTDGLAPERTKPTSDAMQALFAIEQTRHLKSVIIGRSSTSSEVFVAIK